LDTVSELLERQPVGKNNIELDDDHDGDHLETQGLLMFAL
jgi:hypothetical protein